jgi:CBS domain containing-hemolysin-like protein
LPGGLHPDEVADQVGCVIPEGEYETFAGFLLDQLGHLPAAGEKVLWGDWSFEVAEMDRRRISRVTVRVAMPDTAGDASESSSKSRKRGED